MRKPYILIGDIHPDLNIATLPAARGFAATPIIFHKTALKDVKTTDSYLAVLDALTPWEGITGNLKKKRAAVERTIRFLHGDLQSELNHPELGLVAVFATHDITSQHFWKAANFLDPVPGRPLSDEDLIDFFLDPSNGATLFSAEMMRWLVETPGAAKAIRALREIPGHNLWGRNLAFFLELSDKLLAEEVGEAIRSACASHQPTLKPLAMCRI